VSCSAFLADLRSGRIARLELLRRTAAVARRLTWNGDMAPSSTLVGAFRLNHSRSGGARRRRSVRLHGDVHPVLRACMRRAACRAMADLDLSAGSSLPVRSLEESMRGPTSGCASPGGRVLVIGDLTRMVPPARRCRAELARHAFAAMSTSWCQSIPLVMGSP